MAFFARPNLDNTQFKQLVGSELTLSGQTQIATITGFTLTDGAGTDIPVTASGASNNFDVLTYCDGTISLLPSTASGGTGIYECSSPTTCSVGGLPAGTPVYGSGVTAILECIIAPTVFPTLTNPSISSFTLTPSTTLYEIGSCPSISATVYFDPGVIDPQYPPTPSGSCRSDGTICYVFSAFGSICEYCENSPSLIDCSLGDLYVATSVNTISATICHYGGTQPHDSSGSPYCSPLSIGVTPTVSKTITGTYPWYRGKICSGGAASGANRPTACCIKDLITGGTVGAGCTCTKVVGLSNGTIYSQFCSTSDDYLWFATPSGSTSKTWYYVTDLNQGAMGGAVSPGGNLFPDPDTVTDVTTVCWNGQSYKIYVSNYQTSTMCCGGTCCYDMQLRNS